MAPGNPQRIGPTKLCIAIDDRAVMQAVAAARAFAASADLPTEPATKLAIVIEELVANLVDHADLPDDAWLELSLAFDAGAVAIILCDPATPFDPRRPQAGQVAPPIPERGGAAGLALVQAFARIDRYDRDGGRNILCLSLSTIA